MVYGMMHQLSHMIEAGKRQAVRTGQSVLTSTVCEAGSVDFSSLFSLEHDRFCGNRFFWSEPGRELALAGLGAAYVIESDDGEARFHMVEEQWRAIVETSMTERDIPPYTGPHLFGGFSFDPERARTDIWRHYPHTRFVVPEIMLTQYRGRTWMTVNRMVNAEGHAGIAEAGASLDDAQLGAVLEQLTTPSAAQSWTGDIYKEEIAPGDWLEAVKQAAASIRAGDIQKVVLARHIRLFAEQPFRVDETLRRLLREQDNTYVFAVECGPDTFVGATPERLMEMRDGRFQTLSLAGSIGRGATEAADRELGQFLFHDLKNLHEHELAVEMIRDVMVKMCDSVQIPETPILYRLKDIQHLLTPISGQARSGATLLQAVEALHPTPALGGMPRDEAIIAIRQLEQMDRGWYAAPIGWLNRNMEGEFAAAIRSALIQGREASLYAGCGIVGDSDPLSEYEETSLKFRPMLSALGAL